MRHKLLYEKDGARTFAVVFDTGDDVTKGLLEFAKGEKLTGSHFTAIGAFEDVELGYFDLSRKDYVQIALKQQVEVLSLVGNVALHDGEPKLHAHVVVGLRDGHTRGGHLLQAHVRPTLEVVMEELPRQLQRRIDSETNLPLIEL